MGHNRLPRLPATKAWKEVADLMDGGAPPEEVVFAAATAAQKSFTNAIEDPVYADAVFLLVAVSKAARHGDFIVNLKLAGLPVDAGSDIYGFLDAIEKRLDAAGRAGPNNSDMGVLARRALLASLYSSLEREMPGLFPVPDDLARAARTFSSPDGFSELARTFFTRLTSETLAYWLDRTMAAQIGTGRQFKDIGERDNFDAALAQFSAEATRIIKEFSAGWYARNIVPDGEVSAATVRAFAAVAFKKINAELSRKVGNDG